MNYIDTPYSIQDFSSFLNKEGNNRIIFSGKFGTGKTTFLNHYFEDGNAPSQYFVCKLYPINYVTSNNKDIYELIKYDILIQLLKSNIEIKAEDLSGLNVGVKICNKYSFPILKDLAGVIPVIGENLSNAISGIEKIKQASIEYINSNPQNRINDFLKEYQEQTGSPYEQNDISTLIKVLINKIKATGKKTTLIIDDFDRLEPIQTFRVLNIFSTNSTHRNDYENRFGFDKIIIVCDINNIRDSYIHINGLRGSFNGYIDKFYSKNVYHFDIMKDLEDKIYKFLDFIKIEYSVADIFFKEYYDIFKILFIKKHLTIRSFSKLERNEINIRKISYFRTPYLVEVFFYIMKTIFPTDKDIEDLIADCANENIPINYMHHNMIVEECLNCIFSTQSNSEKTTKKISGHNYSFQISTANSYKRWTLLDVDNIMINSETSIPIFDFLKETAPYVLQR